ncbi:MAG: hypothetical protein FJ255_12060, partial [Phycisphaerae bacterium]|nr:hypothetical protein [Phycisphaerae bacterium]
MSTIETHAGHAHHEGSYLHPKGSFLETVWDWATTLDHKKIGIMYLVAVLTLFFIGGLLAIVVRLELLDPVRRAADGTITGQMFNFTAKGDLAAGNNTFNRLFTLHGAIMVFMVIIPSVPASLG